MKKISFLTITLIISVVCSNNLYSSNALVAGAEQAGQHIGPALGGASAHFLMRSPSAFRKPAARRFSSSRFEDPELPYMPDEQREKVRGDLERWVKDPSEAIIEADVARWADDPAAAKEEIIRRNQNLGGGGSSWDYPAPPSYRSLLLRKTTPGISAFSQPSRSFSSFKNFPRAPQSRPIGRIRKNMLTRGFSSQRSPGAGRYSAQIQERIDDLPPLGQDIVKDVVSQLGAQVTRAPQFDPIILNWLIDRINLDSTYLTLISVFAANPTDDTYRALTALYNPNEASAHLKSDYAHITRILKALHDNNMENFDNYFGEWQKIKDADFTDQMKSIASFIKNMTLENYQALKAKYNPEKKGLLPHLKHEYEILSKMFDVLWENRSTKSPEQTGREYLDVVREAGKRPQPRSLKQMEEDYLEAVRSANEPR